MIRAAINFILMIALAAAGQALAETKAPARTISLKGRESVTITTEQITLGDIAEISSPRSEDDETIIALQKIPIDTSPAAGQEISISGVRVLEKLRAAGVDVNSFGYALPRAITARRAARTISAEEVRAAIEQELRRSSRDAVLKTIRYDQPAAVVPGELALSASAYNTNTPSQIGFTMRAAVPGQSDVVFNVDATVDEWREVPVAKRALGKGAVIGADDVMMARLNLNSIPRDAADGGSTLVGLATSAEIGYGEVFNRRKLAAPIAAAAGSKVTILFRSKFLEATASGVALDSGAVGQQVRVRNESSNKIVNATVIEPGLVGVTP